MSPAVVMFPPVTFPVATTRPAVVMLLPVTLPVAMNNPAAPKLPTLALPVVEIVFEPNAAKNVATLLFPYDAAAAAAANTPFP